MWSEERNCEVSADLPTPGAPSIVTLYRRGGGPVPTSTAGRINLDPPAPAAAAAAAGNMDDLLEALEPDIILVKLFCGHRMAHRKWRETKQQANMLPGPAVPGS